MPKYLQSHSALEESYKAFPEASHGLNRKENEIESKAQEAFEEYREHLGSGTLLESKTEPFESTEPAIIRLKFCRYHYEDGNGMKKLRIEKWKKSVMDLNIELRLVMDVHTGKLQAAFLEKKFIVSDRVVTDFGDSLFIFRS